ncbi:PREDICTED: uncharacterized protein LOC108769368 isoform X2 [Trachymyrmex cornetzi]|uniref:Uncharacterized protein n=1 Tax=Trachymyrmex cornetzi TaxID=471704 RepID=A0A195DAI7_9HYME|nr:PREDICTED: uncharacterized protein LOC108769368 isoform X2 [Trachymyrmex cornetzi]KYN09925.1 hypothetical protein ALC57_17922 [Trachymyrmex cornetzi]
MQEEQKKTPKLGTIRKIRNAASTPDIARNLSNTTLPASHNVSRASRSRVTLMPGDIAQLQKVCVPRKKIVVDKQSIMPSQIILDAQKKMDSEELELGLLYDEYLQTMMMDLIMKKKLLEKKRLMIMQMAAIAQEIDQDTQKLIKIKTRERDIINLSLAQKEADCQLIAVTKYAENETFKIVKDMLSKLYLLLEPLDVLRCNGIILPETQTEWKETQEILNKCSNVLRNTANLIGSKGEMYCAVNAGLKNFTEAYDEIKDLQKKLEEVLCNFQVLMLKNASLSLACDDSG